MPMFDPNNPMPDLVTQAQEFERQKELANILRQRYESTPAPQGSMVGGRYIAPSFTQQLSRLFGAYQAGQAANDVSQSQRNLAQATATARKTWQDTLPQTQPGIPGHPELSGPIDPQSGSPELAARADIPQQVPSRGAVLKATLAGMDIPGNAQAALLWNKGMGEEITREDTQADKREALRETLKSHAELKAAELKQRAEDNQRRSEDTRLSIEERAQAARQASEDRRNHDATLLEIAKLTKASKDQLKPLPSTTSKAWLDNNAAMKSIDQALAGMDGHEKFFGLKYALPEVMTSKLSPESIEARARVFNLGSLKIKDRSGTAVSVKEFERLRPFIPNSYDNAEAVKTKLRLFKQEYQNMQDSIEGFADSQGYKSPSDTARDVGNRAPPGLVLPPGATYVGPAP